MFRRSTWSVIVVGFAIAGGACGCKKKVVNPFPVSGALAGWEKTSETRTYEAKDLWQYLDGEAEQYLKAGVATAATSDYEYEGQLEAVVDIYTMGDSAGARQMMESGESNNAKAVPLGDAGIAYEQSVTFRKGPYLVRIVAYENSPGAQEELLMLAHGVEARL